MKLKIPNCKCGGEIEDDEMVDFYGSIEDGYLTEEHLGVCQKCGKEYIVMATATILPETIKISIEEN